MYINININIYIYPVCPLSTYPITITGHFHQPRTPNHRPRRRCFHKMDAKEPPTPSAHRFFSWVKITMLITSSPGDPWKECIIN